ncbi:hypothetical protein [Sphingomonas profundi]|uniref:hypothetical protein n=1 Tax=Alterirhizorhabdus profundi TaxID=2681549 RepID=UPI001E372394|nr:hypothetical protein [Sphingomonas profundi]
MLKQLVQFADLAPVEVRHFGMKKRGRLASFGKEGLQVALALLHDQHLRVQAIGRSAPQDHIDQPIQVTIDLLDLGISGLDRFPARGPHAVHLAGELLAEFGE